MKNITNQIIKISNKWSWDVKLNMGPTLFRSYIHAFGIKQKKTVWKSISKQEKDFKNDWHKINWKKAEEKIKNLQEKIVIATINKDFKTVYLVQSMITNSFDGKALAVRRVITNKGGKTAGVDKIVWNNPKDYWKAILTLTELNKNPKEYKASPLRRVWIPKPGSSEKRPIGIPTMIDRAMQALYHLGIDPVVETQSDPNSYGFRKHRSTQDAITAIRSKLDKKEYPKWILEIDISKCFDKISHEFLMENTPMRNKEVLKQWLKSGIMEELNYTETSEGIPQGGIISPTLCNIALNGIEKVVKEANPLRKGISTGVHLIRYVDDMISTARTKEIAERNRGIIAEFLAKRGLSLNDKKTKITHIKEGFDFLGFNIRRRTWNPKFNANTNQETVLIIKPADKGIKSLKGKIQRIITMNKPIKKIIAEANPVLRGWGEHKRISYHTQEVFITIDHWIQTKMRKWAYWHKGSIRNNIDKYLVRTSNRKWNWGISLKEKLINLGEISIIQLRPLKLDRNPYIIENLKYFNKRRERIIEAKFRSTLYKKYKQTCPVCGESLHNGEIVELHHIIPQKISGKI